MRLANPEKLKKVIHECMLSVGVENIVADTVSNSLVQTSLRGVDSHGIRLFPHYFKELTLNKLNKSSIIELTKKSPSITLIDAKNTFGHYAGQRAINEAIITAQHTGIGVVSVSNSTHFGAAWYFTNQVAEQGMLGLALTNTEALVNAYNSKEAFFGTNPICFSAPMLDEDPYCLDMATSTVSWNKIKSQREQNSLLNNEWAYDVNGLPTEDPYQAVSLSSIGGYKGFGLGMLVEILCSGLTAGPISKEIAPLYDLSINEDRKISHFFMAIDISKFVSLDWFKNYLTNMSTQIRNLPKSGDQSVMVGGDKEKNTYKIRLSNGIPIEDAVFNEFLQISDNFKQTIL